MTQTEQKSAVRTFGQQVVALGECLFFSDRISLLDSTDIASRHIQEAEARGAEEQRRKDAEGYEPVYQIKLKGGNGSWQDVADLETYQEFIEPHWLRRTLYTRPANVAALEARVKALEVERDRYRLALQDIEGLKAYYTRGEPAHKMQRMARAALTREGGV